MKIRLMNVPPMVYMTNKTVFPVLSVPSHGLLYLIGKSKSPVLLILSPYELKKLVLASHSECRGFLPTLVLPVGQRPYHGHCKLRLLSLKTYIPAQW